MTRHIGWIRRMVCGMVVVLALGLSACGAPWRDTYFKKGVERLTQEEIREQFGPPHTAKAPALGGDTIWTYRVPMSDKELDPSMFGEASQSVSALMTKGGDAPKPTLYCYRYTLIFNEQKVLTSWKRDECVPGTRDLLLPH